MKGLIQVVARKVQIAPVSNLHLDDLRDVDRDKPRLARLGAAASRILGQGLHPCRRADPGREAGSDASCTPRRSEIVAYTASHAAEFSAARSLLRDPGPDPAFQGEDPGPGQPAIVAHAASDEV